MCGLIGVVTSVGGRVSVTGEVLAAACDVLAHRGPDGAGVWREGNVAVAHRRLAVIDSTDAGAQPMVFGDRRTGGTRLVLAYNGELYNDAEVRGEFGAGGAVFTSHCDTQTLGEAVLAWGDQAARRLRGMYAFAAFEPAKNRLTLARDPLGIKPLYWTRWTVRGVQEVAFASEAGALAQLAAAATGCAPKPDMVMVSAYLTTIRTTLGSRTMFQGVRAVEPGEWIEFDLSRAEMPAKSTNWWRRGGLVVRKDLSEKDGVDLVRGVIADSVHRHLRSDVPVCALLSGGLDSSITTCLARREKEDLLTFAAGAVSGRTDDDLAVARECAAAFGTRHSEAVVDEAMFQERWGWMVERMGLPLSTPNEVAINQVARTLRAAGCVVTLSGEGADELFAGYDQALDGAAAYIAGGGKDPGMFELDHVGWVPVPAKAEVLRPDAWRALEQDAHLTTFYREQFARVQAERDDEDPLQAHLRWQRRINLVGLLQRLGFRRTQTGVFPEISGQKILFSVPIEVVADGVGPTVRTDPMTG